MSEIQSSLQSSSISAAAPRLSSWKRCVLRAVRESDTAKLIPLIREAEEALFVRWMELGKAPGHAKERAEMSEAANDLWTIKIYKLGWPGY